MAMTRRHHRLTRFRRPVAALLLAIAATTLAPTASTQTMSGIGSRPCTAVTAAGEQDSGAALDAIVSWAQGFISGFNWANVRQSDVRLDGAAVVLALGDYCARNPREPIYRGLQAIIARNAR